ncbi:MULTISPECIES: hypothetical protein [Planktothricoides]|uniref:Transposase n=1 Tax=Planktothricoides raciborskii FACHB-1370 TaxID=2949576 RepID=A0ABR8E9P9_9CYAN|nr:MULTISPECIES: hypothetical protein [Planktothricoides]MBD2543295.1 hypothetical protein [Planktothricoides raciborskii FACHB-1370]MBD2581595.1 hypothetical protein [Planktothricoides raciborskii FACHB-1261]
MYSQPVQAEKKEAISIDRAIASFFRLASWDSLSAEILSNSAIKRFCC